MSEIKYNGFNNGRDKSDGVGGNPPEGFNLEETKTPEEQIEIIRDETARFATLNDIHYDSKTESMILNAMSAISQPLQSEIDRLKAVCDSMAERNRKLEDALRNCNSALEICRDLINNDEFSDNINSGIAFNEQLLTPNNE